MVAEVFAGIGALKTAFDMAKGLKELDDAAKRNAAVIDLQQTILTAQQAQMGLLNEISELKERLKAADDKRRELDRYEMVDVRGDGRVAYRLKEDAANGEPTHLACPVCFKRGEISILQFRLKSEDQDYYDCFSCKIALKFGKRLPTPRPPISRGGWMGQ